VLFNRPRALEYMRRCDLDALVATSPINVTYFSGYHCWSDRLVKEYMIAPGGLDRLAQRSFALFARDSDPALVVTPVFAVNAADIWVKDLYTFGGTGLDAAAAPPADARLKPILERLQAPARPATPVDALVAALADRGLDEARVGLEMQGLDPAVKEALARALPRATLLDASNLILLVRMAKTDGELARLRRAAEINEIAAFDSLAAAVPGTRMSDVVQRFRVGVAELGADVDHFAYGMDGVGIGLEPEYLLTRDDVLFVDFGCVFGHYLSDGGTTLAMAEPSADLRARHAAIGRCLDAGLAAVRPCAKSSAVRDEMWRVLQDSGFTASFPHGHAIGLELREYPILVADNGLRIQDDCVDEPSDVPLEAGMVINLEAAMFVPGAGSVHMEKSFVVTDGGSEPLIPQDRRTAFRPDGRRTAAP
jgi:Xaa-Pro dipeptidase